MPARRLDPHLAALLLGAIAIGGMSGCAYAADSQEAWLQDDVAMMHDPAGTLQRLRVLGVARLRLAVRWLAIAPRPGSRTRPSGFDAADPAAYPARNWAIWDTIVRDAQADGITVNFNVVGGAPLWATARGAPRDKAHPNWSPSAREFGAFVRALGMRYSGQYTPSGASTALPRVSFWSIWNEPNYGPDLAPQAVAGTKSVEHSPSLYRGLLDAAWSALRHSTHGSDSILFGELAPHGGPKFGVFAMMKPLFFLRALYCVDSRYRELRGAAAAVRGCPTTAAGSRAFRRSHPALFAATGFADHPYSLWFPPNIQRPNDPNYSDLANIAKVERSLDRVQRVYGSHRHMGIWNTEYGYLTSPPKRSTPRAPVVSPATAARYLNQAEYMSWRDPRIESWMQYLLSDPLQPTRANNWGGYASGLLSYAGRPKSTYDAWRLPLYMPVSTARSGQSLEVWGCVRPAYFALRDLPADPENVQIMFQPESGGGFSTLQTVPITDPHGYFDVKVQFTTSGTLELAWAYPSDDPQLAPGEEVYSRQVPVTIR